VIRRDLICAVALALAVPATAQATQQCTSTLTPSGGTLEVCLDPPASITGDRVLAPTSTKGSPSRVTYTLDGSPLLVAFDPPFAFTWPSARYAGGPHTLGVRATAGGTTTPETSFSIVIDNPGSPPATGTFAPRPGTAPATGRPFSLAAGGDGAGGETSATAVTDMIASWSPNMMLYLGDVYDDGTIAEFYNWYGQATHRWFARFNAITNPVIGNHEYDPVLGNAGYVGYWGTGSDDIYTVDVAGWHLIALNSNAQAKPNQLARLQADLAAVPANRCTLAYFHHPMFNTGPEGPAAPGSVAANLWAALAGKADIVLTGHDHSYQRFKPVSGVTEFVVGTAGHSTQAPNPDPRLASFFGNLFGALRAELNPHGFGFRFIDEAGTVLDSGAIPCGGRTDLSAPATPTGLAQGTVSRTAVELRWETPADDVGVTGYDILRDGAVIGTTAGDTRYVDATVQAGTAYTYRVQARDGAGHLSAPSARLVVLASSVAFLDTFESGNLAAWTTVVGPATVTAAAAHVGSRGLHLAPAGGLAYTSRTLLTTFATLEAVADVRFTSHSTTANLLTFLDATGGRIVTVVSQGGTGLAKGRLCYSVGVGTATRCQTTSTRIDDGGWHKLRVSATAGASSQVTVLLDDEPLSFPEPPLALGSARIARLVVGANVPNQTFAADFDEVAADPLPIGDLIAPTAPSALNAQVISGLQVNLAWSAAQDDVGVTGYQVFRNGLPLATMGLTTSLADRSVDGLANYTYTVRARDAAGNISPPSPAVAVATPIVLRERFDTAASLKRFTPAAGLRWHSASKALRLRNNAYGRIALPATTSRLFARIKFRITTRGVNTVPLLALRSPTGAILTTALSVRGALGAVQPASARWHDLQVHADTTTRVAEVWLDGRLRTELTRQLPPGLTGISAIDLGGRGRFDMLVDDLEANTRFMTDTVRPSRPRVSARTLRSRTVSLSWTAARDDVGVAGYRVFRGAIEIGRTTDLVRRFVDRKAPPGTRVVYGVRTVDAAGNLSPLATKAVRVPWLSDPRRRLVRAGRAVRLNLPAAGRAVMLSLRVRPRTAPRGAVVARLGTTTVRFPRAAQPNRWITIRVRVPRPGTSLRLGGPRSFDVHRVIVG
jgi:chitodextrinase